MTTPITSYRSFYDLQPETCHPDAAAPSAEGGAAVGASASPEPTSRTITLDAVYVEGDLGARQLVERYEQARKEPSCDSERATAAVTCMNSLGTALGAASTGPWLGGAIAIGAGIACGKELAALYTCEEP